MSLIVRSHCFPAYCRSFHCCSSKLYSHNEQNLESVEQAGPLSARLASRSVISFRGPDTVKFLQGLLTNDVKRFEAAPQDEKAATLPTPNLPLHAAPPMYAALLTPQGRFLYDLFLYRPCRSDEKLDRGGYGPGPGSDEPFTLLADVDAYVVDEILACFKRYRLRAKVEIDDLSDQFSCWQQFGGGISSRDYSGVEPEASSVGYGGTVDHAGVAAAQGNHFGWQWYKDPRLDSLGFRGLFPSDMIPPLVEANKQSNDEHYLLWRLEKGVAEGTKEIPKGEAIPLEFNFAALNAISFDKGCYVGQELIARTHHRGVIRKRLLPLRFVDKNGNEVVGKVAPGSEVINIKSGKKAGTVTTAVGYRGMGVLRLEEALNKSHQLSIQGHEDVNVKVTTPDWWPEEWAKPQEQTSSAS